MICSYGKCLFDCGSTELVIINLKKMSGPTDIDNWLATVKDGGVLPERDLRILCEKIKEILIEESNVQPVSAPVTICGDIHG